ncbi:amidase [Diaporthe helianthi]|uniref:Amidase n=1 Tax=Diaporthe helianthi TaxID=158607 RepID=A0A2P5HIU9_DIAHE|nr:amidase [Diaporthe helianthi]
MTSALFLLNAVVSLLVASGIAALQHPLISSPRQSDGPLFPPLIDATLADLSTCLERGVFTSVDLVQAYIARIKETNDLLHAVTEINPDALTIAASLDAARRDGQVLGPLHGIPVLIKNNIATSDKMNNTAGSYALLGATVPSDSTVASKLRKAGAVILGKSNLSQWSGARSENSSSGWSAHGGQTQGAYYPAQSPCGSSAGSGVAASLGLAWAALGTETSGSIQCPACYNNVVGIKPTVGLTSRHLVIPISEHQDTVGPLARTVEDAAFLLQAIVGKDKFDNYTSAIPFDVDDFPDYVSACQTSALRGKRIAVTRGVIDTDEIGLPDEVAEPLMTTFNESLDIIRSAGATVVDDIFLPGWKDFVEGDFVTSVLLADFFTVMPRYLSHLETNPHNISSLRDISSFTHSYPDEEYPARDTKIFDHTLEQRKNNTDYNVWTNRTLGLRLAGTMGILGAMKNYSLDAIVLPTYFAEDPPAMLGTPAVTVPMGRYPDEMPIVKNRFGNLVEFGPNVPFGISFLGESFTEEKLIGMAYAFEQRTMIRQKVHPYLQPKTEIADVVGARLKSVELEL